MGDAQVQRIDECLSDEWLDEWTAAVVRDVEAYLGKHAAFHAFLEGDD
jgi:hypothetical protein